MLVASDYHGDLQAAGLSEFHGVAQIEQLQQALAGLAQAAGWPAVDPGPATGSVNDMTLRALGAAVANLSGKLDKTMRTALQAALAVALVNSTARSTAIRLVNSYADYLTQAIQGLSAIYLTQNPPPMPPPPPTGSRTIDPSDPYGSAAAITAFSPAINAWRVAYPQSHSFQFGGPSVSLGAAYVEASPMSRQPKYAQRVSEKEFERLVGQGGFFRANNPALWATLAGGLVLIGGVVYAARK